MTKTSIQQPRELWNKVRSDAINQGKKVDEILTEILSQHYLAKTLAETVTNLQERAERKRKEER